MATYMVLSYVNGGYYSVKSKGRLNVVKGFLSETLAYIMLLDSLGGYYNIIWQPYLHVRWLKRPLISFYGDKIQSKEISISEPILLEIKSNIVAPIFASGGCSIDKADRGSIICTYAKLISFPASFNTYRRLVRGLRRGEFKEMISSLAELPAKELLRGSYHFSSMEEWIFSLLIGINDITLSERCDLIRRKRKEYLMCSEKLLNKKEARLLLLVNPLVGSYILAHDKLEEVIDRIQKHISLLRVASTISHADMVAKQYYNNHLKCRESLGTLTFQI